MYSSYSLNIGFESSKTGVVRYVVTEDGSVFSIRSFPSSPVVVFLCDGNNFLCVEI